MFFPQKKSQITLLKSLKMTHALSPSLKNSESLNMQTFMGFKSLTTGHTEKLILCVCALEAPSFHITLL